jgi:hypothetical protein
MVEFSYYQFIELIDYLAMRTVKQLQSTILKFHGLIFLCKQLEI